VVRYTLEIKRSAQNELDALDDAVFTRIDRKILVLADDPRPTGCKKLKGYKNQWRVRVGEWRVIYVIDDAGESCHDNSGRTSARSLRIGYGS
jgi:mRNA interferase RelE/StbE